MSSRWRTFKERFHQKALPLGADKLKPTSNERCSHMLAQARTFLQQLRKCEQAVRRMAAVNADSVTVIRTAMTAPLPLLHGEPAAGEIGGQGFQGQRMAAAVADASHKKEAEVLAPLTRWQDVLTRLSARFKGVGVLRLEVDSRRRTVLQLSQRVDAMRAQLSSGAGDAKQKAPLEQRIQRLQRKEGKLQIAAQSYADQEQVLHRDLATLISDARWLKHYMAAALRLQGTALLMAADAFGSLPQPSPPASRVLASPSPPPAVADLSEEGSPLTPAPYTTAARLPGTGGSWEDTHG